jgi:hypothetical protein
MLYGNTRGEKRLGFELCLKWQVIGRLTSACAMRTYETRNWVSSVSVAGFGQLVILREWSRSKF